MENTKLSIQSYNKTRYPILFFVMIGVLASGIGYSWSIIQPYVMEYFSIDSATASWAYSLNFGIFVIGSIIGGKLQQKYTPRTVVYIGVIVIVIGLVLTALLPPTNFWLMVLTFSILTGIGGGITYNTRIAVMQRWFPDKKGFATGAVLCALGFSGFVMSPVCSYFLGNYGFRINFLVCAAMSGVLGVLSAAFTKNPPQEFIENFVMTKTASGEVQKQYTTGEMLRTKEYYIIAISMMCAVPAYMLINPIFGLLGLERGIVQAQIMGTVMVASVLHALGRLIAPTLSDKLGRKPMLILLYIVNIAAVLGMIAARGTLYMVLFPIVAFIYGGFMGTYPVVSSDYFGTKHAGINYALVMIGFGLACVLCPFLSAAVQKTESGTALSFAIAAAACIIGIILVLTLKKKESN